MFESLRTFEVLVLATGEVLLQLSMFCAEASSISFEIALFCSSLAILWLWLEAPELLLSLIVSNSGF